jgi:hypothetical protein
MLRYTVALAVASLMAWGVGGTAQESTCLHGPSELTAERARRQAAVQFARQLNTLEHAAYNQDHRYRSPGELPDLPEAPDGFRAQLSTDGSTYTFSLKDARDSCHFAYFSDQQGLIYTATPIR